MVTKLNVLRGSFLAKTVKAAWAVRCIALRLSDMLRASSDDSPLPDFFEIGKFRKDRRILDTIDARSKETLSSPEIKREPLLKEGTIRVVGDGNNRFVEKSYKGPKKFLAFYTELVCLQRMQCSGLVPKVHHVDHRKCKIYLELLQAVCLNPSSQFNPQQLTYKVREQIMTNIVDAVACFHQSGIAIYDLEPDNVLVDGASPYFIDFADSVPMWFLPKWLQHRLSAYDFKKIEMRFPERLHVQ